MTSNRSFERASDSKDPLVPSLRELALQKKRCCKSIHTIEFADYLHAAVAEFEARKALHNVQYITDTLPCCEL